MKIHITIMSKTNISVPQGDCVLSVYHNKRTVALLRTGEKGATLSESHNKIQYPEFERGWLKVTHTSIHRINVFIDGGKPSFNTCRELGFPTKKGEHLSFEQACIGHCHDLAYEVARSNGHHLIQWELYNPQTGKTLTCQGEWSGSNLTFNLSN